MRFGRDFRLSAILSCRGRLICCQKKSQFVLWELSQLWAMLNNQHHFDEKLTMWWYAFQTSTWLEKFVVLYRFCKLWSQLLIQASCLGKCICSLMLLEDELVAGREWVNKLNTACSWATKMWRGLLKLNESSKLKHEHTKKTAIRIASYLYLKD